MFAQKSTVLKRKICLARDEASLRMQCIITGKQPKQLTICRKNKMAFKLQTVKEPQLSHGGSRRIVDVSVINEYEALAPRAIKLFSTQIN